MSTSTSSGLGLRVVGVVAIIAAVILVAPRLVGNDDESGDRHDRREASLYSYWEPRDVLEDVTWTHNDVRRVETGVPRPFFKTVIVTEGDHLELVVPANPNRTFIECYIVIDDEFMSHTLREGADAQDECVATWDGVFPSV